jgi:hypothetical protein
MFALLVAGNFVVLYAQTADWTFIINSIPYNSYSLIMHDDSVRGRLTIFCWSRNGKILVHNDAAYYNYQVIDLVEDKILHTIGNRVMSEETHLQEAIIRARSHDIEPVVSDFGKFPYEDYGDTYKVRIQRNSTITNVAYDLFIDRFHYFYGNGTKLINTSELGNTITDSPSDYEYWYAKSPYENRIAVIAVLFSYADSWRKHFVCMNVIWI